MKISACLALAALLGSAPVLLVAAEPPGSAGRPADSATGTSERDAQWARMQERMKLMQQQVEKIRSAKDPQERRKLLDQHLQSMREGLHMMRDCPAASSERTRPDCYMKPAEMDANAMHRRMQMMDMMMEQMAQHQDWMQRSQ